MKSDNDALERVYKKVAAHILPFLFLSYIVAYIDRVNVSFAKLQMLHDLNIGESIYGLGAGLFFIGYFLFEVPSNVILHRIGARKWIAVLMVLWGVVSAGMMFVTSAALFCIARFLLGAAEAGFFPGVIFYLTLWYPAARRAGITSLFMTAVAISGTVGGPLSGYIMENLDGSYGWAGWQWLFLLEAIPAVALGVGIFWQLQDRVATAPWLGSTERSLLNAELALDAREAEGSSGWSAFRDARVWLASLIYFCAATGLYGIGFWLPTIIQDMGITTPHRIGWVAALPYFAAAVSMMFVGKSADKRRECRWHFAICSMVGSVGLGLSVVWANHPPAAVVALVLATAGTLSSLPLFWSFPTTYLQGASAATGIAIINSFGNLAGFAAPFVMGVFKDLTGSMQLGTLLIGVVMFANAVLAVKVMPPQNAVSNAGSMADARRS